VKVIYQFLFSIILLCSVTVIINILIVRFHLSVCMFISNLSTTLDSSVRSKPCLLQINLQSMILGIKASRKNKG
jgi:hypothetical protein